MKTKTTIITLLLLAATSALVAQEKYESYACARITELSSAILGGGLSSKIYISYSDGTHEAIELVKYKDATFPDNTDKITQMINKLNSKGYSLVSSSMAYADAQIITTMIFGKK